MRFLKITFIALTLTVASRAADQLIDVTVATLDGWNVTGTNGVPSADGRLILPAGSQLSRQFSDSAVVVHLVTRPEFSEAEDNWSIFGVGSTAVAFVRQNRQGHLLLVVDESKVIDLPGNVPLGSKQDPVDLILAYDRVTGTALVSYLDQVRVFDAKGSQSTDIWLSAGARSEWPIDTLQVLVPHLDATGTGSDGSASSGAGPNNSANVELSKLRAAADRLLNSAAVTANGDGATRNDEAKAAVPAPTLEVFTPPSVRRTQIVSAVLNAVSKSQRK